MLVPCPLAITRYSTYRYAHTGTADPHGADRQTNERKNPADWVPPKLAEFDTHVVPHDKASCGLGGATLIMDNHQSVDPGITTSSITSY